MKPGARVALPVWCILLDGPAAGAVCELEPGARDLIVTMGCGNEFRYTMHAATPHARIARFRWMPPSV